MFICTNKLIVIFQRNNQKKMSDASKLHQQELYNEKLANKKNEVDKHVKETLSSRKKNKKQKSKKNDRDTNVISRIENVNKRDFDMEYNFGKIEIVHTIELIIDWMPLGTRCPCWCTFTQTLPPA